MNETRYKKKPLRFSGIVRDCTNSSKVMERTSIGGAGVNAAHAPPTLQLSGIVENERENPLPSR